MTHPCFTPVSMENSSDRDCKAASVRKQLGPKNSKSNEGRHAKNGGIKGRDASAEELAERLTRSRLRWDGHVERMADDRLPKSAVELRE